MKGKSKKKRKSVKKPPKDSRRFTPPADKSVGIALCMIVKDEEEFLDGCLESVKNLVDEMVIVDTGSNDRTKDIARSFNATVLDYKWQNDFSAARNYAMQNCSASWILYLDADERLNPEYHEVVRQAVNSGTADAFHIKVFSKVSGALGNVPHVQSYPRLFRKLKGVRFEGSIHEQVTPSLKRINARFRSLDVTIEHLGYARGDQVINKKIKRNLNYLFEQVEKEPDNAYAVFQLGQTLLLDGQIDKGLQFLEKLLANNHLPNNLIATTLLLMGNEYYKKDDPKTALDYVERAIRKAPRQRLGYFIQSECLAKQGNWAAAVDSLQKLIKFIGIPFSDLSVEKDFDAYLINQRMALYLFNMQQYGKSLEFFEKYFREGKSLRSSLLEKWSFAWKQSSASGEGISNLLQYFCEVVERFDEVAFAAKTLAGIAEIVEDRQKMEFFLNKCLEYNTEDASVFFYLGNLALEKQNFTSAEKYYRKALEKNKRVWEVYYNYSITKIKQSQFSEAIKLLEKASPLFPDKEEKIRRLLIGLYAKTGQYEKAIEHYQTAE